MPKPLNAEYVRVGDLSRKVTPFDPQMVREAINHYEWIGLHLLEMAEELEQQVDGFRSRSTDARLKAEYLRDLLAEFPDGRGTERSDGSSDG